MFTDKKKSKFGKIHGKGFPGENISRIQDAKINSVILLSSKKAKEDTAAGMG